MKNSNYDTDAAYDDEHEKTESEGGEQAEQQQLVKKHKYWTDEVKAASKRLKKWQKLAEKIVKRYLAQQTGGADDIGATNAKQFRLNLFYSNTITLESMLYGSIPKIDVSRRYADTNDDVSRVAAETMKRLLNSDLADNGKEVDTTLKSCLQDRLLAGLACARVRYEIETAERPAPTMEDSEAVEEYMVSESAPTDYYFWGDVLWGWSRNFAELPWMGFRNYLTKAEVAARFSDEVANELTYSVRTVGVTENVDEEKDLNSDTKKTEVWEIWDKATRKVYWYNEDFPRLLDCKADPLGLSGFFPAPPFFMANATTSLYIPTPDFKMAEDLYNEVDILQTRISILTEAVKAVGVYDAGADGVQRIFTEGTDNKLIPVDKWAAFSEKGGLRGTIEWVPIVDIVNALDKLVNQRNDAIGLLQQVTGMSDIMRGQLQNQYEGVGQSDQKAKFGSVRVQALQEQFAGFATDLMQLKSEVIARHFSPETIAKRSNMMHSFDKDLLPQAIQLIKDPDQSRLSVKIQSESMAMVDYAEMRAERTEFLNAVSNFVQSVTPIIQQRPESEPFMLQLMQWGLAGYKGSQQIESLMDKTIEAAEKAAASKQGQPSPEEQAEQQRQQAEGAKHQQVMQQIQAKAQADMQMRDADKRADMETAQHQHILDMKKIEAEAMAAIQEIQTKAQAEAFKQRGDAEANIAQSAAGTEQEIQKSAIQSELKIRELITAAQADLEVMQKQKENEADDNGDSTE